MTKTFRILGRNIHDIPAFYAEINRVFMANEDWALGNSLDAFNDLLYGGYGAIDGQERIDLVWQDLGASRSTLGVEATRAFLTDKLNIPLFDTDVIASQLDALERGVGQTYFDIVLDIIADHPNIRLVPA